MTTTVENIIIGIGELHTTNKPVIIKTYALGSCISVIIRDKRSGAGSMSHIALPDSRIRHPENDKGDGYYVDTALPLMIKQLKKYNLQLSPEDLQIFIIGGSHLSMGHGFFRIGERNVLAAKSYLLSNKYRVKAEDTGESISRTVMFDIAAGTVTIKNQYGKSWNI